MPIKGKGKTELPSLMVRPNHFMLYQTKKG